MVPYNGGAFLPAEQRYTSPIFRRLRRIDRAEWLSLSEAAELVGMIRLCGFRAASFMFQWSKPRANQAKRLLAHPPVFKASEAYLQANLAVIGEEDGLAALRSMMDGGWRRGVPPEFVCRALQERRKRGDSMQKIADDLGFTYDQITNWLVRHYKKPTISARSAGTGLLIG